MVHFLNPNRPVNEQIKVWCERHRDGFRLVRREPCGELHWQGCVDYAALFEASARLQATLTRSGWRPAEMPHTPLARRRATRAGQFHR